MTGQLNRWQADACDGRRLRGPESRVQGTLGLSDERLKILHEGLRRVIYARGGVDDAPGTASRIGFKPDWDVRGKTGTAEKGGNARPDAWFACFAPAAAPEIVVVVVVESAGHGGEVAGPLARQMLAAYFGQPEPHVAAPPKPTPEPAKGT